MANQSIAIALAFGVLAFTLSVLPATPAKAGCQMVTDEFPHCPEGTAAQGGRSQINAIGSPIYTVMCCTVDKPAKPVKSMKKIKCSNPNATYNAQLGRCALPMKQMGRSKTGIAALRNACGMKNWVWDEKTQRCKLPSQAKADCEARGSSYRYDLDTQACVGGMSKGKRKSQAKAECEERGPRFRYDFDTGRCIKRVDMSGEQSADEQEFDDEDFQLKKKKKKPRVDVDVDIF